MTQDTPTTAEVAAHATRLAPQLHRYLPVTPLVEFRELGARLGLDLVVKCEHLQRTGSFKARGALAKMLTLTAEQREQGVVTASTGNHGLGVAHALARLGGRGTLVVPETAAPGKVEKARRAGLEIVVEGVDSVDSEAAARRRAAERGLVYVPPYNDLEVVAGQGTAGVELLDQLAGRPLDAVVVTVGGGGLVSGIGSVLAEHLPGVRIVGVSPVVDAGMAASVRSGHIVRVDAAPTLSEGSAGNVEAGSVTFPLVRAVVDDWVLVTEDEIRQALRDVIDTEHQLVEGAAAAAFAGAARAGLAGARVAVVSCGANISADALVAALDGAAA